MIVADSGLIAFSRIGRLDLLRQVRSNCNTYKHGSFPMSMLLRPRKVMESGAPAKGRRRTVAVSMAHLLLW
jgi:hypothetical protein